MPKLITADQGTLTDDGAIVAYLRAACSANGFELTIPAARVLQVLAETAEDDDPESHLTDLVVALEEAQNEQPADDSDANGRVPDRTESDRKAAGQVGPVKTVSAVNSRAAFAYGFAAKTEGDATLQEHFTTLFKAARFVRVAPLVFLVDLERIHGEGMDEWPRVPTTDDEREADLDPKRRSNNPFAYKDKRNGKTVTRDFPKDYFDRSGPGKAIADERAKLASDKEKIKAKGVLTPKLRAELADIEDAIRKLDTDATKASGQVRKAMILRQHIKRVREDMPKVQIILKTRKDTQTGLTTLTEANNPIRLAPKDNAEWSDDNIYDVSVSSFMSMDVDVALAAGGDVTALVNTNKRDDDNTGGAEDYGTITSAHDAMGYLFVFNHYHSNDGNNRMLRAALNAKNEGKPTEDSDLLLAQLGQARDYLNGLFATKEIEARYEAMADKDMPQPKIKAA